MSKLKDTFFRYNSRPGQAPLSLSPYFMSSLDRAIAAKHIDFNSEQLISYIVHSLVDYANTNKINNVVIGMSGGIDSAVTAALFKEAGWTVHGYTLPIHQAPEETARGIEACQALGINHVNIDLSDSFGHFAKTMNDVDTDLADKSSQASKIRLGNIRARLRMITLYNFASKHGGLVASTDNFSELAAGFWTLHGDVGDLAPIQSLTKSWEVPMIAETLGLPTSIVQAAPTDGLGIDNGDEAQFGYTYAQADLILLDLINNTLTPVGATDNDIRVAWRVQDRIKRTSFKRVNPSNVTHPIEGERRYGRLAGLDNTLHGRELK